MIIEQFKQKLKQIDPNLDVKFNKIRKVFELYRRRSYLFKVDRLDKRVLVTLHEGDTWKEKVTQKIDRHNDNIDEHKDREFAIAGNNFADKATIKNY